MTWGPPPEPTPVWTPTTCNQAVQERLRGLRNLRVRGEVSGVRQSRGHVYFELKDAGARLRCTVWRSTVQRQRLQLRDGQEVICHGSIDLWVAGGTYALNVQRVEDAGVGRRWAELQRLKAQLQAEGLFDPARRQPLPRLPRSVGIVTARTGAALQDMLRILHERYPVRVVVAPAKVQGAGAAQEIAAALRALDRSGLCDVILVGRGGGSIEDLWAFNEEVLVRAVAACRTPVVSAVGHETDTLLTDHAADRRAATPTAAAEMVVPHMVDLRTALAQGTARMAAVLRRRLRVERRHLGLLSERVATGEGIVARRRMDADRLQAQLVGAQRNALARRRRRMEELRSRLHRAHPMQRLAQRRRRLDAAQTALRQAMERRLRRRREAATRADARLRATSGGLVHGSRRRLDRAAALLRGLNPRAALGRGYSIVRVDGVALRDAADAAVGAEVQIVLARGEVDAQVLRVRSDEGSG